MPPLGSLIDKARRHLSGDDRQCQDANSHYEDGGDSTGCRHGEIVAEPTVVTVTTDHQTDSPKLWILDPGAWRSTR